MMSVQGSNSYCTTLQDGRQQLCSCSKIAAESLQFHLQERMQLGNPVHWSGKRFWTKHELASNMRFLSKLADYRPSDQVYLTTIIVAQQLGGCKLGWMQLGNPVQKGGERFWHRTLTYLLTI